MRKVNWVEVDEAKQSDYLPRGGYVMRIADVDDNEGYELLDIIFDVAEGQFKGKFADTPEDEGWRHRIRQGYGEKQERYFKQLLSTLEQSNPGFTVSKWQVNSDPRDLVGLQFGVVLNYGFKINTLGNLSKSYRAVRYLPVDRIRRGDFTVPAPEDDYYTEDAKGYVADEEAERVQGGGSDGGGVYEDLPF